MFFAAVSRVAGLPDVSRFDKVAVTLISYDTEALAWQFDRICWIFWYARFAKLL
jgi:hypothetical protein